MFPKPASWRRNSWQHVRTENESSQCRSWELTNHNLSVFVSGGAYSESCFFLFAFHVARSVQLVLVQGQQLALQVDTIGKHGLPKDHHMRTYIPRMLSSAWRTRRIWTSLQVKESQLERDPFGYVRAPCRGLMILMKSKMVRKSQSRSTALLIQGLYSPVKNMFCSMCVQLLLPTLECLLPCAVQSTCV